MPHPDPRLPRQSEQFLCRSPQRARTAAWEIRPRGADVGVEERVAAEDVGADAVPHVVGGVAGEVQGSDLQAAYGEDLVFGEEAVEGDRVLCWGNAVARAEQLLYFVDARAYADLRPGSCPAELGLQVRRGAEVVGVRVGFEDVVDGEVLRGDEGEEGGGGGGAEGGGAGVEV